MWPRALLDKLFRRHKTNETETMGTPSTSYDACHVNSVWGWGGKRQETPCQYPNKHNLAMYPDRHPVLGSLSKRNSKPPFGYRKKLEYLRKRGVKSKRNHRAPVKKSGRSKFASEKTRGRQTSAIRARKSKRAQRKQKSRKTSSRKGNDNARKYPTQTQDLINIRVRKRKRYTNGERDQHHLQVRPLVSCGRNWDALVNDDPRFLRKNFENDPCEKKENPLNLKKVHGSYVKSISGVPARTVDQKSKRRRSYSSRSMDKMKPSRMSRVRKRAERAFGLKKRVRSRRMENLKKWNDRRRSLKRNIDDLVKKKQLKRKRRQNNKTSNRNK